MKKVWLVAGALIPLVWSGTVLAQTLAPPAPTTPKELVIHVTPQQLSMIFSLVRSDLMTLNTTNTTLQQMLTSFQKQAEAQLVPHPVSPIPPPIVKPVVPPPAAHVVPPPPAPPIHAVPPPMPPKAMPPLPMAIGRTPVGGAAVGHH
jgi:hypothetical protein